MVREGTNTWLFGKVGVKDAVQLPTLDAPDTMLGGFTRGISTFLTGWMTGGRIAKGVGVFLPAKAAIKATQAIQANPIKTSLVRASFADTVAFDEHMGRLTDVIINYAPSTKDTWLGYLASDPNDTFWEGRFKNAIEGLALGGTFETIFKTFRFVKNKEDADFLFQRVGGKAGWTHKDFTKSWRSHFYIAANDSIYQIMKNMNWDKDSPKFDTAGNPSITKDELIKKYELCTLK